MIFLMFKMTNEFMLLFVICLAISVLVILTATGVVGRKDIITTTATTEEKILSIPTDPETGNVRTIVNDHYQLHLGNSYLFSEEISSLANGSSQDYLLNNKGCHLRSWVIFGNSGPLKILIYENTTTTDNGTLQTVYNMKRTSSNTNQTLLYKGPTVSSTGNLLDTDILYGSKKDSAGNSLDNPLEWILDDDVKYLLRITNSAGSAQDLMIKLQWYEQ